MNCVSVRAKNSIKKQTKTLIITPDDRSVTLKVVLQYRPFIKKWLMTITDLGTGQCLVSNIPLVSSENVINDLLFQFKHLRIGSAFVVPESMDYRGIDPVIDNIQSYQIIWGDSFG